MDSTSAQYAGGDFCFPRPSPTMGGGGTMGGKGGGGRKMAAAATSAAVVVLALTAAGISGPRLRAASTARLFALLLAAALSLVQVSAVEVYTPSELSVENGTEAKLPCTFTSSEVISSAASVTWSFQAEGSTTSVSFLYYSNGKTYPGKDVPFKDRISWAGDLNKKDASINIANMRFLDNGTYTCDVKNPPDIVVVPGEIKLRVVEKVQVSAVEVYTPSELSVENGTEAKLPCTFTSSEMISCATSVTWSFQAEGSTTSVLFFYYINGKAYLGKDVPFKDRISWAGDLNKKDASINIANMRFLDNGTYTCDVKNPPDIVVVPGEIKLRVVEKGTIVSG